MLKTATTVCVLHSSSAFSIHHQKVISDHTFQTLCISLVYSYTHIIVYTPLYVHHCMHIHHLISECQDLHLGAVCVCRRPRLFNSEENTGMCMTAVEGDLSLVFVLASSNTLTNHLPNPLVTYNSSSQH